MRISLQPDPLAYPQTYPSTPSTFHMMSDALHQSVERVLKLLVGILPGLLAFVLALLVLTGLGMGLSWLLRKALTAARFDDRLAQTNSSALAEWSPNHSPTQLVGRIAFWACVLLGVAIGISAFDVSYEAGGATLGVSLFPYLTHVVVSILILFAGNLMARFLARTVLIGAVNNQLQYARFLSIGVKWLVLVLTAAMVLEHLRIGGGVVELAFGILFGGIVLTLALAIGLGSRDLVSRSLEQRGVDLGGERTGTAIPFQPPAPRNDTQQTLRHF